MLEIRNIAARVHGRYLVRPGAGEGTLVGLHGYAETAETHMAELERIPGLDAWTLVAVQALHPFYIRAGQQVGASWMTSLDRDLAIADNIDYVLSVVGEVSKSFTVFLGFSQGAAMAYRAAAAAGARGLVVHGGDVPADVNPTRLPPILIGRGRTDEWYSEEKLEKDLRFLAPAQSVETVVFEGGHEWTDVLRDAAGQFLRKLGRQALQ